MNFCKPKSTIEEGITRKCCHKRVLSGTFKSRTHSIVSRQLFFTFPNRNQYFIRVTILTEIEQPLDGWSWNFVDTFNRALVTNCTRGDAWFDLDQRMLHHNVCSILKISTLSWIWTQSKSYQVNPRIGNMSPTHEICPGRFLCPVDDFWKSCG